MKRLMLFFVLIFAVNSFAAQVVIREKKINIHILEDGRVIEHVYEKIDINGFSGMRRAGEWFFTYNPKLTEVKILKSITHTEDGKAVSSPENAILDFSPYSVENAPDFSYMREKIVSHTGLEPKSVVEFEYEVRDKIPHRLVYFLDLRDNFFIEKVEISIVDNGKCRTFSNHVDFDSKNFVFVAKNIKPARTNLMGENYYANTPYIAFVINPVSNYLKDYLSHLSENGFNKVKDLMDIDGLDGKALCYAVFDFVDKKLNTVNLGASHTGYKCRDFYEIVKSGYATDFEKAVLAYWVLNNSGLNPSFLLKGFMVENALIKIDGYGILVDGVKWPSGIDTKLPYYDLNGKKVKSPYLKASLIVKAEEGKDGFEGNFYFEGNDDINFSLSGLKKKSDNTVEKGDGKVIIEGTVSGKIEKILKMSNWIASAIPAGQSDFAFYNFADISYPIEISELVVLTFEKPVKAVFHSREVKNSAGFSSVKYSVNGKTLKIERRIKIEPGFYSGEKMKLLRDLIIPVSSESYNTVIFN